MPALAIHWIQSLREAGESLRAADLARRAGRRYSDDADLFYLELVTRSSVEDEAIVLAELEARIDPGSASAGRMRVSLANRHLLRGDPRRALEALGYQPPGDADRDLWFDTRGMALAQAGDLDGALRNRDAWTRAGGDPAEVLARYALQLSLSGMKDPERTPVEWLRAGLAAVGPRGAPALREALTIRLILTLVNAGEQDEALALYDRGREEFALEGLARDELLRSAEQQNRLKSGASRSGTLHFLVSDVRPGDRLLVSPDPGVAPDAPYERIALPAGGEVRVERDLGDAPQRWVLERGDGSIAASGTSSPRAGGVVVVPVAPGAGRAPLRATLTRAPADGRRRVALLLLDCGDWRITQYLRTRGELPVLDALLREGHRAVLDSDPPLTAAALEALVYPERRSGDSLVGLLYRMGVELAGLSSVGENPVGGLSWLLPEDPDLFSVVGAGERSATNLLFAHGGIEAGRHSVVTGPHGARRRVALARSARDLDPAERERWPALAGPLPERDAIHVRTIAAELDEAESWVAAGESDLLALRVEPLDILTHGHFAETVRDGQDDGEGLLFEMYRYLDARVGAVANRLDADDVLIVMSDHGIRTAMEHSRDALFVAAGPGVATARAPGRPPVRSVARSVADLLDVDTAWPDAGLTPDVRPPAPALARPRREDDPRPTPAPG